MTHLLAVLALIASVGTVTPPDPPNTRFTPQSDTDGVRMEAMERRQTELQAAPRGQRATGEVRYVVTCPGNTLEDGDAFSCQAALAACRTQGPGAGPLAEVWRRTLNPGPGPWRKQGTTCFPRPTGRAPGPALTAELIRTAWSRTPFSAPVLTVQPPGGRTLINVPTYLQVHFSVKGYGPGETHTVTLLGHRVQIRPVLAGYRYGFGDGTAAMATMSPGGPYPEGDVTHTYPTPGTYRLTVEVDYSGEYSVDGGPWQPIRDTITIPGSSQDLQVLTAETRLLLD